MKADRGGPHCGTTGTFLRVHTAEGGGATHSGMFQLAGRVLPHCSVARAIHMSAHKACWEQTCDMRRLETFQHSEALLFCCYQYGPLKMNYFK